MTFSVKFDSSVLCTYLLKQFAAQNLNLTSEPVNSIPDWEGNFSIVDNDSDDRFGTLSMKLSSVQENKSSERQNSVELASPSSSVKNGIESKMAEINGHTNSSKVSSDPPVLANPVVSEPAFTQQQSSKTLEQPMTISQNCGKGSPSKTAILEQMNDSEKINVPSVQSYDLNAQSSSLAENSIDSVESIIAMSTQTALSNNVINLSSDTTKSGSSGPLNTSELATPLNLTSVPNSEPSSRNVPVITKRKTLEIPRVVPESTVITNKLQIPAAMVKRESYEISEPLGFSSIYENRLNLESEKFQINDDAFLCEPTSTSRLDARLSPNNLSPEPFFGSFSDLDSFDDTIDDEDFLLPSKTSTFSQQIKNCTSEQQKNSASQISGQPAEAQSSRRHPMNYDTQVNPQEFRCKLCKFQTSKRTYLLNHIRRNHFGVTVGCTLCSYSSKWKQTMKLHYMKAHRLDEETTKSLLDLAVFHPPPFGAHEKRKDKTVEVKVKQC